MKHASAAFLSAIVGFATAIAAPHAIAETPRAWYAGAGYVSGDLRLEGATRSAGASYGLGGTVYDVDADPRRAWYAVVGRRFSEGLRVDLAYEDGRSTEARHMTRFASSPDFPYEFNIRTSSSLAMVSAYAHARGFAPKRFTRWDPYVGLGIGQARNRYERGLEGPVPFAEIAPNTESTTAWRLVLGTLVHVSPRWNLDIAVSATKLGSIESGGSRTFLGNGPSEDIGAYKFDAEELAVRFGAHYEF